MNAREQAVALRLLQRWYDFVRTRDTSNPTFARTYVALKAETADFLGLDNDPPRTAAAAQQVAHVSHDAHNGTLVAQDDDSRVSK
jgi:hypothetical protein